MAKLRIDLDVLERTIQTYQTEIENIREAKTEISKALSSLKASGWDSQASKVWFSLLDDEWLKNIEYQIRVLNRLCENLKIAETKYSSVEEELNRIANDL